MKQITFEELCKVLENHATWLRTRGAEGKRANLEGCGISTYILDRAYREVFWLKEKDQCYQNLSGAVLNNTCLRSAWHPIMSGYKLYKAHLNNADLEDMYLSDTDLRQASLRNANLRNVKLEDANLAGADLTGADLTEADLTGAILTGAILTGTKICDTVFDNVTF